MDGPMRPCHAKVVPAQAGIQWSARDDWVPAYAGMTDNWANGDSPGQLQMGYINDRGYAPKSNRATSKLTLRVGMLQSAAHLIAWCLASYRVFRGLFSPMNLQHQR